MLESDRSDNQTMPTKSLKTTSSAAAQLLGRLGGSANTKAQNAARKRNAQHAGRPRRVCTTCGKPVKGGHVDRRLDETCGAHGWTWNRGPAAGPSRLALVLADVERALDPKGHGDIDLHDLLVAVRAIRKEMA